MTPESSVATLPSETAQAEDPTVLTVVAMTDSFGMAWENLGAACSVTVEVLTDSTVLEAPGQRILLVSAAGQEGLLPGLLAMVPEQVEVAAVGALPDHRVAVAAMRAGAAEYFALPGDLEPLVDWVRGRAARANRERDSEAFARREAAKYRFEGIVGGSEPLHQALRTAARIIPHGSATVLITGETGTGKELLARAIHYNGPRRDAPFVEINCAAIPENLLESELFGHEKGAFTHATSAKPGLFEVADGGTVFLDEVGHLPLALQGKLLRVLQDHCFRRLGGTQLRRADVRIIAATHVDLETAAREGGFREDLLYRLNVLPIHLPPLRSRGSDLILLARHFLVRFATDYGLPVPRLSPAAERRLVSSPWPGNIRELRNVIERAVVLCRSGEVQEADLGMARGGLALATSEVALRADRSLEQVILDTAAETLRNCRGNKSEAARRLQISRTRLQRILGQVLDPPRPGGVSPGAHSSGGR